MPKINVYLPDDLAEAVREAQLPVSSICQVALEAAVRDVSSTRAVDLAPDESEPSGRGPRLFSHFSPRARAAVAGAEAEARTAGFGQVGTEHLLIGVLDQPDNMALAVLEALEIEPPDLRAELVASMPKAPGTARQQQGRARFSAGATSVLEASMKEALGFGRSPSRTGSPAR
jgi:Clp amino terminal domain, pathogenicity island component